LEHLKKGISLGKPISFEVIIQMLGKDVGHNKFIDIITAGLDFKIKDKQELLEISDTEKRLAKLDSLLVEEMKIWEMEKKLMDKTQESLGKMQREVILREQLKTIEKELGMDKEGGEIGELNKKIVQAKMPPEANKQALKELERLRKMSEYAPESSYIRTYLEWLSEMPWSKKSKSRINIKKAKEILDRDHYGLDKVKERVSEFLAVQKLAGKIKGPILCFIGPPGVGKTSIGKSIAEALNRKFIRASLGGIRDEAEIRGHRRTYVGALPGRIIQGIKKTETRNPVFMLDEIDKIGADYRGDPSAALLEALDPEQNNSFVDHYLELPFDLSDVMFITTANVLDTIPSALRDRLEIIEFVSYTEEEKFNIARRFLIPKVLKEHGIKISQFAISDEALKIIISKYTLEAGVRGLERQIAKIARKEAKRIVEKARLKKIKKIKIDKNNLSDYLGPEKFLRTMRETKDVAGVATGLAWTSVGGEILSIEASCFPGKGSLNLTGQLGDVMKESAQAAFSYVRSRSSKLKIKRNFYKECDVHLHVPSGAIPKDGPSAGVAMAVALASALTKRKIRQEIAMTGEITLRGKILEIGGVKEKVIAARKGGVKTVLLPKDNEKDLEEVPAEVKKALKFKFVENVDEVLDLVLI
jgi:ATP-dependent Lon protease